MERTARDQPEVSLGGVERDDRLPWPEVHYPPHYGTFLAFAERRHERPRLCDCTRPALRNLAKMVSAGSPPANPEPEPWWIKYLPDRAIDRTAEGTSDPEQVVDFGRRLCHRCHLVPPTRRWCHEMYGGRFKQTFGWYINQVYFRLGIQPITFAYLSHECPPDFQALIDDLRAAESAHDEEHERVMEIVRGPRRDDIGLDEVTYWANLREEEEAQLVRLRRQRDSLKRKLRNSIENITREEFGFRRIGEGWVSETLVYQIVRRVFPESDVLHHHRPEWLGGMELDIFVPGFCLGIEYQGQQHFHPVEAWGGYDALQQVQARDKRKRQLCTEHGVRLLEVDYTEPITEEHIRGRLLEAGVALRDR